MVYEPMPCKSCHGLRQKRYQSEIAIHLPWMIGAPTKPHELLYPNLLICLDCGFAEFQLPRPAFDRIIDDAQGAPGEFSSGTAG